ncbi:MAG: hypothetical protein IJ600_04740 [Lachnospiraceae bacterium]|nr:hypothetical protein [Lachnospiraceae bacterium]
MAEQEEKKGKKKRGQGGLLLFLLGLIALLVLLGGKFGLGGLGGLLPGGAEAPKTAEEAAEPTAAPTEAETAQKTQGSAEASEEAHVIVVGEQQITLDGNVLTAEELSSAVAAFGEGTKLTLKEEHALMESYTAVKEILDAAGLQYTEEK